jgi:hypothetical protein
MRYHGLLALMLTILAGAAVPASAKQAAWLDTRVTRAALFKNGLGFLVREGQLPAAKTVKLGPFSAPAHGTFWVTYPQQVELSNLVGREVTITEERPAITVAELLRANVGREVEVVLNRQDAKPVRGRLLSFPDDRQQDPDDPYAWGRGSGRRPGSVYFEAGLQSRLALIQTADGVVGVDSNALSQVTVLGDKPASTITRTTKAWEVEARLSRPAAGKTLTASYLAKGITWAPSYVVDISDPSKARISAKAEIINEAENLDDVHLDLVTGFANLRFADIVSPIAGKETLAQFLAALARGASERGVQGAPAAAVGQAAGAYLRVADREERIMPEYGAAAAGATVEDLFLYPLEHIALEKGARGYYPLFSAAVPYSEIHQWEIPDYVNQEDRYGEQRREQREMQEEVWHSLRLTNNTKLPWTTAPVQTIKAGQVLGQDTLKYTSPATNTILRINRAMAVQAEQTEFETARKRDAGHFWGYSYDLLTVEGHLRVANHKDKPVNLEVTKNLSGDVKQTTPEAKVERIARGLARMNPSNVLTWGLTLQPGEQKELTYTYDVLIRR